MKRIANWIIDERVVAAVITLNAIVLFWLLSENPEADAHFGGLAWVDYVCVLFFIAEAATKIGTQGWDAYWRRGWNRFDFLVTVLSLPVLMAPVYGNLEAFNFFTIVRLGRLFRLFRVLRFIPHLPKLMSSVPRALLTSTGLLLALMLTIVILAMGATIFFGRYAPDDFGDPLSSMYSMFRVLTVEGWLELPQHIAGDDQNSWIASFARFYFSLAVLIGGVFGMSLVTAVLVDELVMDNQDDLSEQLREMQEEIRALRNEVREMGRK